MHRADITAALKKAGSSQAQVARTLGMQKSAISNVLAGRSKSAVIRREISKQARIPVSRLWPNSPSTKTNSKRKGA